MIIEVRETWKDRSLEGIELTALCCMNSAFNLSCLIGGTSDGRLLIFPSIFSPRSYNTYFVHNSAVTTIKQSADGRFLFTSGEDGSIFIFSVSEYFSAGQHTGGLAKKSQDAIKQNVGLMVLDEGLAEVSLIER